MIAKPFTRKSLLSETRCSPTPTKAEVEKSMQLAFDAPVEEGVWGAVERKTWLGVCHR